MAKSTLPSGDAIQCLSSPLLCSGLPEENVSLSGLCPFAAFNLQALKDYQRMPMAWTVLALFYLKRRPPTQ